MLWSKLFIPTLRENPAEGETASRQLLLRAGYVRQAAPGSYRYLFLAQRSLLKISRIVREEMGAIGGQEMLCDAMPSVARELRSYRQLRQIWYEIRGASVSGFTFDLDAAGQDAAYRKHFETYSRIFDRCGIQYRMAGGEFMVETGAGPDSIVTCPQCGYAANREQAVALAAAPAAPDPTGDLGPEQFHTPGCKTIAEVAEFTGLPATSQMKSLVLVANGKLMLALVRGDHQLSETKFAAVTGDPEFRPARPEEIRAAFGADAGSLGPVGLGGLTIVADHALHGRRNMIAGANRNDYHLRHVTPGEDFTAEFQDLRRVEPGDACASCGAMLEMRAALAIGSLAKSESADLRVTNAEGEEVTLAMGRYGMNLERILIAAIELYHDSDGMRLPPAIAPFDVVVTPVNIADAAQRQAAEEIYRACLAGGLDALLDDRDERPGVKFKDADLIGVPFRITVGKKLASGMVELIERRGRERADVPVAEAAARVRSYALGT